MARFSSTGEPMKKVGIDEPMNMNPNKVNPICDD